jgi:hypothetical protein
MRRKIDKKKNSGKREENRSSDECKDNVSGESSLSFLSDSVFHGIFFPVHRSSHGAKKGKPESRAFPLLPFT